MPYWQGATYQALLHSFLSGRVTHGPELSRLRLLLIEALGATEALLCGSGSLALEIALRACGVRQGDEVVIPSFCCTSIVPPILAVGASPVFADVGEELNLTVPTVEAVLTKKTTAIIVPHLFGNPADISSIIEMVRDRHIRVIDDAAQAVGAHLDGRPVGSFGDAGILSFGSEKVCFGLGGGVVVTRSKELFVGSSKIDLASPQQFLTLRNLLPTLIWRHWRCWTKPVQSLLSRIKPIDPNSPPIPYRKEAMANLNAAVALTLMQTLSENIAGRRARVRAYQALLGQEERLALISHRAGSACLTQVLQVLPRQRGRDLSTKLIEVLGNEGYEVQGSYLPIHLLADYQNFVRESLPTTERIWADLIELPCEPTVSFDHVERIAVIVKQVINS